MLFKKIQIYLKKKTNYFFVLFNLCFSYLKKNVSFFFSLLTFENLIFYTKKSLILVFSLKNWNRFLQWVLFPKHIQSWWQFLQWVFTFDKKERKEFTDSWFDQLDLSIRLIIFVLWHTYMWCLVFYIFGCWLASVFGFI